MKTSSLKIFPPTDLRLKFDPEKILFGFSKALVKCKIICHWSVYASFEGNLSRPQTSAGLGMVTRQGKAHGGRLPREKAEEHVDRQRNDLGDKLFLLLLLPISLLRHTPQHTFAEAG